jgi:DinB superfamily
MKVPFFRFELKSFFDRFMSTSTSVTPDTDLRFPVGQFRAPESITPHHLDEWLCEIEHLPARLRQAISGLTDAQLDTPYRPGGWTVRQVVHHLADSHINAYTRFRLTVTEDSPVVKPYEEALWAELPDAKSAPLDPSLGLLNGLHQRWTWLLRSLKPSDWQKAFRHPEHARALPLDYTAGLYAWHCRHHVAHITRLRERSGW